MNNSTDEFNSLIGKIEQIIGDVQESKESLKEVERSLSNLPSHIDTFSTSINSLNEVVTKQKKQLSMTLDEFNESIVGFRKSVDEMAVRFSRKPKIKIGIKKSTNDSLMSINAIVLTNSGDLIAEINTLRFRIPTESLIKFTMEGSRKTDSYEDFTNYQVDYYNPKQYVFPDKFKPRVFDCDIKLKKEKRSSITIYVYYLSSFGNDGTTYDSFLIE